MAKKRQKKIFYQYIKLLNYINVKRKEVSNIGFENSKYILLTGKYNTTLKISRAEEIKASANVPLATDLNFITNLFWFKLNKGLGNNEYPKSFDIVTKSQIILLSRLNESLASIFEELQTNSKNGNITENEAAQVIAKLRQEVKKPEEIGVN